MPSTSPPPSRTIGFMPPSFTTGIQHSTVSCKPATISGDPDRALLLGAHASEPRLLSLRSGGTCLAARYMPCSDDERATRRSCEHVDDALQNFEAAAGVG